MPILTLRPVPLVNPRNHYEVTSADVGRGEEANRETVEVMKRIVKDRSRHPIVRTLALKIVHPLASHAYLDEARAIAEFVQKRVRYVRDALSVEQLHDPLMMIDQIERGVAQGDCDDMALLIATLIASIGGLPLFRIVKYRPDSPSFAHIYVVTYTKNGRAKPERLVMDAIMKDKPIGFEVQHKYGEEISL